MRLSFNLTTLLLACSITGIAQKQLTIDEIFTKTDLSPKSIKGLQWIPNTNAYTSIPDEKTDVLLRTFADKGTTDTLLKASMLSAELKRMPAITWLDANRFYFRQKNQINFCQIPFSKIASSFDASDADNIDI